MIDRRFAGGLPGMGERERALAVELRRDLVKLAEGIGERNYVHHAALCEAADWIEGELRAAGYVVRREPYEARGQRVFNLEAELRGTARPGEIVVVGGHYDSVAVPGCKGANDNGTGVVATLALARAFAGRPQARSVRFVLFVNEEPPFFQGPEMGSVVYARGCRGRGEDVVAMLSLETMGCFSDEPGSQHYPAPYDRVYPTTGNFIAFVGNEASAALVERVEASFDRSASIPSVSGTGPESVQGIGWSDHWSFWQEGYPALMVTDTAPYRYAHYHTDQDTVDKVDFERLARVTAGLEAVVRDLAER